MMNASARYVKTQAETASRERLLVLLLQAALKHVRSGAELLERGDKLGAITPLTRANEIVSELMGTLDPSRAPELCATLTELYTFVTQRIVEACARGDARAAREAERVFAPIVDGFSEAVQSLAGQPAAAR